MDWIAAVILAIGIYFTGKHKWWGWLISGLATLMWIYIGYEAQIYGMVLLNFFLLYLNIKNCLIWYSEQKEIEKQNN